jgi:hypothetical protein
MRAVAGDELLVKGRHVGDVEREGVIVEVHGANGAPPYLVRWKDRSESVLFPSSGTVVEHRPLPEARQAP